MDKILKKVKNHKWFLIFVLCVLWYIWYTHPRSIQDELEIVNIESGEHYYLKLDIYQKKSPVRKTQYYGSVWLEDEEFKAYYSKSTLWEIGGKIRELFEPPTLVALFSGIKKPEDKKFWDYLTIDYDPENRSILVGLFFEYYPFTAGIYFDKESAEQWKNR